MKHNYCRWRNIRTNMSRKGGFECQTDSPRRPHLRPRKGTNLGAGNPSPASCSASSRCQPCAPLARLKKYFQPFRANPSTSTLPQDGACQREALGARSALVSHLAKQGQGMSTEAKCDTDDDCCLSQRLRLASIQRLRLLVPCRQAKQRAAMATSSCRCS